MTPDFAWADRGPAAFLLGLLNDTGEARFVGGCVRDSLLGRPPGPEGRTDIDIATTLAPDAVMELLTQAEVRCVPTGLEHGTVTAIIDHVPYEVTTLRRDVETNGRHARVEFTRDWEADAGRRDFTINALYRDQSGQLYDYFGGQDDLAAACVRFIGKPEDRLREDFLRILRFLRFSARYAEHLDTEGWSACVAERAGLASLSKERIWQELQKIFSTPKAPMVLAAAKRDRVLREVFAQETDIDAFTAIHQAQEGRVTPSLGLAALWPGASPQGLEHAFRLSHADRDLAVMIHEARMALAEGASITDLLYRFGREAASLAYELAVAISERPHTPVEAEALENAIVPSFPFTGKDILAEGVAPGRQVGQILSAATDAWRRAGYPDDVDQCRDLLMAAIHHRSS